MKSTAYIPTALALVALSCATTKQPQEPAPAPAPVTDEVVAVTPQQPEKPVEVVEVPAPVIDESQLAFDAYKAKISDITLSLVSAPREVVAGKAFSAPFVVKALYGDGSAVGGLDVAIRYPLSRGANGKEIVYEALQKATEADGTLSVLLPTPTTPFNAAITFAPAVAVNEKLNASHTEAMEALAAEKCISVPYKVRTRFVQAGGSIALVDYTAAGKPITSNSDSSSKLLAELMKRGFIHIGNADFTSQVDSGNKAAVYKAAQNLFGTASAYLIYGTVKYAEPVAKTDGAYTCTLVATVTCLNMKDGSILYATTCSEAGQAANETAAITAARIAVAKKLSEEIYYGM